MADEQSPDAAGGGAQVSQAVLIELGRALAAYSDRRVDDGDVRRAIRAIASEARAKGIRAEQLIASLKQVFESLTHDVGLASRDERAKRLAYLVTTCVREYYAPDQADAPGSITRGS